MPESGLILPPDSSGKATRTNTQTTTFTSGAGGQVHQQVVALGDPITSANITRVGKDGELYVSPNSVNKLAAGKFFLVGDSIILGAGLGMSNVPTMQLENPPTSTRVLYVVKLSMYTDVTQQVTYIENATMQSPTTVTPLNLNRASANTSMMNATWSTTQSTGGTRWPMESRIYATGPTVIDLGSAPIIIPPGRSLTIAGTSSSAQTTTFNCFYFEE